MHINHLPYPFNILLFDLFYPVTLAFAPTRFTQCNSFYLYYLFYVILLYTLTTHKS